MSDLKDEGKKDDGCCADSSCCPPGTEDGERPGQSNGYYSRSTSKKSSLISKIKTSIFVIIVLAAVCVAGTSLVRRNRLDSTAGLGNGSAVDSPCEEPCGPKLSSLASLNNLADDKDFVFVLLPGGEAEKTEKVASLIQKTSQTISQKGTRTATFTMNIDSPDYQKLVSSFKIKSFPAVLAMGKGCGSEVIAGDITEEALIAGYLKASKPKSSSCCGKE